MSLPEVLLWRELRRKSSGLKFRRQHPIPPYVVDFYCAEHPLIVEIDSEAHNRANRPERDEKREAGLRAQGYRITRISAAEVLADPQAAADALTRSVGYPLHHSPAANGPPPHGSHGEDLGGVHA